MDNEKIANTIRIIREVKQITQKDMADRLKIGQSTYSAYEGCRLPFPLEIRKRIVDMFQLGSLVNLYLFDTEEMFSQYLKSIVTTDKT